MKGSQAIRAMLVAIILLLPGAGCSAQSGVDLGSAAEVALIEAIATLAVEPPPTTEGIAGSRALSYYLGDGTIAQSWADGFPTMPVPLLGAIAIPEGAGPFPVVIVLHGRHLRCYSDQAQLDEVWPCPYGEEPRYDIGFFALLDALSARGYAAVAPSVNGAYTTAFRPAGGSLDDIQPGVDDRMDRILQLHLDKLAAANRGEDVFEGGLDLTGRLDLGTLLLAAHSTAGSTANALSRAGALPIRAQLLLAPAVFATSGPTADIPSAVVLPACDGDLGALPGQAYLETARAEAGRTQPVVSVLLQGANHNYFNQELVRAGIDDGFFARNPACEAMRLTAAEQQRFLSDFAADFFDAALGRGASPLPLEPSTPLPTALAGRAVAVNLLPAAASRLSLLPATDSETPTGDGSLRLEPCGPGTTLCDEGLTRPGKPDGWRLAWSQPGVSLRLPVPAGTGDIVAVRLRAVVDPSAPEALAGEPVTFSLVLTDAAGTTATAALPVPLPFPLRSSFEGDGYRFTPLYPTEIRLSAAAFAGLDLSSPVAAALVFDQTPQGAIFLLDVELLRGQ